jgi:hypothetical protein
MFRTSRAVLGAGLIGVGVVLLGGCPSYDTAADAEPVARYEARLQPVGQSQATGTVVLELGERELKASVSATGLEPGESVPQHVSSWRDCDLVGRAVLNLDRGLTSAGEAPLRGDAFPNADGAGALEYEARRPVSELVEALREYRGMLLEELALDNRTVILHDPLLRPVACGALVRVSGPVPRQPSS